MNRFPVDGERIPGGKPLAGLIAAVFMLASHSVAADQLDPAAKSSGQQWTETEHYAIVRAGAHAGSMMCTDRNYVFREIPANLQGSDYVKMRMDDKHVDAGKTLLQLTLSRPAVITIGYDHRGQEIPEWLKSWKQTGQVVTGAGRWQGNLYAKNFPAGLVFLNGNRAPGLAGMYTVFATKGSLAAVRTPAGHPQASSESNTKLASYDRSADAHHFTVFMKEGGWCWFQDPRAIIHNGHLIIGSVQGTGSGPALIGIYDLGGGKRLGNFVAQDNFDRDDHNSPVFYPRPDGSVLAMYARHGKEKVHYYRISDPHNYMKWGAEMRIEYPDLLGETRDKVTYMNLFGMSAEGKLYCFFRGLQFNPCVVTSPDHGRTWQRAMHFIQSEVEGRHRPYVRYAGNGLDRVHLSFTDAHPRNFGNSIYYALFRDGKFYKADGTLIKALKRHAPLRPSEAELVFKGGGQIGGGKHGLSAARSAWISSLAYDADGHPHIGYSLYLSNTDHRYRIASWNGQKWIDREVAYAGRCLYDRESSYTGLITLDPVDPSVVFISTDVDPSNGKDSGGKHEIYRAQVGVSDDVDSIVWGAVTQNSPVRNIRPIILGNGDKRVVLWNRGDFVTFTNYQLDTVGFIEKTHAR